MRKSQDFPQENGGGGDAHNNMVKNYKNPNELNLSEEFTNLKAKKDVSSVLPLNQRPPTSRLQMQRLRRAKQDEYRAELDRQIAEQKQLKELENNKYKPLKKSGPATGPICVEQETQKNIENPTQILFSGSSSPAQIQSLSLVDVNKGSIIFSSFPLKHSHTQELTENNESAPIPITQFQNNTKRELSIEEVDNGDIEEIHIVPPPPTQSFMQLNTPIVTQQKLFNVPLVPLHQIPVVTPQFVLSAYGSPGQSSPNLSSSLDASGKFLDSSQLRKSLEVLAKPHVSQTADQRPDQNLIKSNFQALLTEQIEEKRRNEEEKARQDKIEEEKLLIKIQEANEKMRKEKEEEELLIKRRNEENLKRQEQILKNEEIRRKLAEEAKVKAREERRKRFNKSEEKENTEINIPEIKKCEPSQKSPPILTRYVAEQASKKDVDEEEETFFVPKRSSLKRDEMPLRPSSGIHHAISFLSGLRKTLMTEIEETKKLLDQNKLYFNIK